MLYSQLKIAFRSLLSNKLFTAINVIGLSIGMAVAFLIFLWVQNELRFDTHHPDADKVYRAVSHIDLGDEYWHWSTLPLPLCEKAVEEIPEIEGLTKGYVDKKLVFRLPNGSLHEEKQVVYIDTNWFDILSFQIVDGTFHSFFSNISSIALTEKLANRLFGNEKAMGQIIEIDSIPYQVNLILGNNPTNTVFQFQAYIPLKARLAEEKNLKNDMQWGNYNYQAFLKGENPHAIAEKLTSFLPVDEEGEENYITLTPLKEVRFNQVVENDVFEHQEKSALYVFGLIGFIILFTAALNYIGLSTALVNRRVKEIGIKKVIGASFQHIFSQVLMETLLTSLIALIIAALIAEQYIDLLNSLIGSSLKIDYTSTHIWLLIGAILLLSFLLAGVYPALLFAGFKPMRLIKKITSPNRGISVRKVLVVSQFGIAITVLVCSIIFNTQLQYILKKNVGYDRSYVIQFQPQLFGKNWRNNYRLFGLWEEELHKIPEFESVANVSSSLVQINSSNQGGVLWEGMDPNLEAQIGVLRADENLQSLFNLKMSQGRWFSNSLETDKNHVILNEIAIKRYKIPEPVIGRSIEWRGQKGQIIGVVKDFHYQSMHTPIGPLLIHFKTSPDRVMLAKTRGKNAQVALKKAQESFGTLLPHLAFTYKFLDESYEQLHKTEADMSWLFQLLSGLLIFISCLGLFGLSTFAVERRTKEIGIRKVLGAQARQIVQLLSSDFLKLVAIALVIACPIAWYAMDTWLTSFAYRISISWWMFGLAGILAVGLAFLTVGFQSFKAAIANPIEALRAE